LRFHDAEQAGDFCEFRFTCLASHLGHEKGHQSRCKGTAFPGQPLLHQAACLGIGGQQG
jgi:hypothetical protein